MSVSIDFANFSVKVGIVTIFLPDYNFTGFSILQDMVDVFGVETNYEAEKIIYQAVNKLELKRKVKLDSEADNVGIYCRKGDEILKIALLIHDLSGIPFKCSDKEIRGLRHFLITWKPPKGQKWEEGDIANFLLSDQTFGFFQIIENYNGSPICALLDIKKVSNEITDEEFSSAKVISILQTDSSFLEDFTYSIIKRYEKIVDAPFEKRIDSKFPDRIYDPIRDVSYSSEILPILLEAYLGLRPWCVRREDYKPENILFSKTDAPFSMRSIYATMEEPLEFENKSLGIRARQFPLEQGDQISNWIEQQKANGYTVRNTYRQYGCLLIEGKIK